MDSALLNGPLSELREAELQRLARVAERLLAGRPRHTPGNRPHRLRAGQGIEFLDHQEYRPGDSLRDIDWLASARSRHPQVRRFRNETSSDWYICLDRSASMGLRGGKWPLAIQLTAALAYLLIHLDNRVAVMLFSEQVEGLQPLGRGQRAYTGILHLLGAARPRTRGGDSVLKCCLPRLAAGCQILVISDFLVAGAMQRDLAMMATVAEGTHAIQVLEQADSTPPAVGDVTLVDIESGESSPLDLTPESGARVSGRLALLTAELASHCRRHRIDFSSYTTSQHWRDVLLEHIIKPGHSLA